MKEIIYFMPIVLKQWALKTGRADIIDYAEFFSLLNPNACTIDRTNSLNTPFKTRSLFDIPGPNDFEGLTFGGECLRHAEEILKSNEEIIVLYSGGLDSTTVLLSLIQAIQNGVGSYDQISVAATPHSIIENPVMWHRYILPRFKLETAGQVFKEMGDSSRNKTRLLTGENGDQLFGSDVLLKRMDLLEAPLNSDQIRKFVVDRGVVNKSVDSVHARLTKLYDDCPIALETMGDAIWWLNFSCKWQSVTLRYLAFSKFILSGNNAADLQRVGTFFNTPQFQWLAMYGGIERWGTPKSEKTYKAEMRKFIRTFDGLKEYADEKVKVPSLYRIFSISPAQHMVLAMDSNTNKIVGLDTIEDAL